MNYIALRKKLQSQSVPLQSSAAAPIVNSPRKSYQHGNNVIIINGPHKGYLAFVSEFHPAMIEVEITVQSKLMQKLIHNDINNIKKIISEIPHKMSLSEKVADEKRKIKEYNEHSFLKKISNNKSIDDLLQNLTNFTISKPNDIDALVLKMNKLDMALPSEITSTNTITVNLTKNSLNYDKSSKTYQVKKGQFKGLSAKFIKTIPAYLTLYINATGKTISNHLVIIPHTNQASIKPITPNDVFYLDIALKNGNNFQVGKINDDNTLIGKELVLSSTKKIINIKNDSIITENDISHYYPGFILTTQTITEPIQENIQQEEPEQQPEFEQTEQEPEFEQPEFNETTELTDFLIGDQDDFESKEIDYTEPEPELEEENEIPTSFLEDDEFKSGFKDIERTTITYTPQTQEEKTFNNYISLISKIINFDESLFNLNQLISNIKSSVKIMSDSLNTDGLEIVPADKKYLSACLVYYELIKSGFQMSFSSKKYGSFKLSLDKYSSLLFNEGFFTKNDINSNFINIGWTKGETTLEFFNRIKDLAKIKDNGFLIIIQVILRKTYKFLESLFGKIDISGEDVKIYNPITGEYELPKLIPLSKNKIDEDLELKRQKVLVIEKGKKQGEIKEIETELPLNEVLTIGTDFTKILPHYQSVNWNDSYIIVTDFINDLKNKKNTISNINTQKLLQFIIDKIILGPFTLLQLYKMKSDASEQELNNLNIYIDGYTKIYNNLLAKIKQGIPPLTSEQKLFLQNQLTLKLSQLEQYKQKQLTISNLSLQLSNLQNKYNDIQEIEMIDLFGDSDSDYQPLSNDEFAKLYDNMIQLNTEIQQLSHTIKQEQNFIDSLNIQQLINEIHTIEKLLKQQVSKKRKELSELRGDLETPDLIPSKKSKSKKSSQKVQLHQEKLINIGDYVSIKDTQLSGFVMRFKQDNYIVMTQNGPLEFSLQQLIKINQ